jgi:hypothetical protein
MPNIRIRDEWEPMVKEIIADLGPRTGPTPILRELKDRVERLRKSGEQFPTDYPSTRTIQRIKEDITPEELREYESFRWPESMKAGRLPWESSAAALELLGYWSRQSHRRTSVGLARWYWYVTQAVPDLSMLSDDPELPGRLAIALLLSDWESMQSTPQGYTDAVEAYLSYAPWRNDDNKRLYLEAIQRNDFAPVPPRAVQSSPIAVGAVPGVQVTGVKG